MMKNKALKLSLTVTAIFIILTLVINIIVLKEYTKKVNNNVLNIIAVIKEKYPNVTDEEIVNILNNKSSSSVDLSKYGIDPKDVYMLEDTKTIQTISIICNILLTLLLGSTLFYLLLNYIKNRKNKIYEISDYIKQINQKKYDLKLEDNNEDELSMLQNELYKITILLKEQSESAIADKKNIKDSMSDISHQLKTPLTSILIGLDNILGNPRMDDVTRSKFLLDIKKQTENTNFLIGSILKLSKFDANVVKFVKQKINIKALLSDVIKNLENISQKKKVSIEINGEADVDIVGDRKWEMEALTNIIKNGIEHLNDKGRIRIDFRKLSIYTELIIEDNGTGIDPKDIKHIFERFYKGKNTSNDSIGIGLSLAKKIIEQDNGYISVESKLNVGTKFTIKYMKK